MTPGESVPCERNEAMSWSERGQTGTNPEKRDNGQGSFLWICLLIAAALLRL